MVNGTRRALNNYERAATGKQTSVAGAVVKLVLLLAFLLGYSTFMYWTLYDAIVLAEGGLEIRLGIIFAMSALVTVWTFAKSYYSLKK